MALDGPIVSTSEGAIQGTRDGAAHVFRGIPYAAPPVGPLRFKPPVRAAAWDGVRPCIEFGAACPQPGAGRPGKYGVLQPTDEDCLFLNVWTPAPDDARRPVMVFLHGGANMGGSGGVEVYNGARTAARGAVVVTVNYRLGALGFLHLAELFDGYQGSGNAGVLDCARAIEWVHENIAAFGGDPDRITVLGSSAGAWNLAAAMCMPATLGLIRRAAPMSSVSGVHRSAQGATRGTLALLSVLGLGRADLAALVALPAARFIEAVGYSSLPALPVVDGTHLLSAPYDAMRAGLTDGIDVLCGSATEESRSEAYVDLDAHHPVFRETAYDLRPLVPWTTKSDAEIEAIYAQAAIERGREPSPPNMYSTALSDRMIMGGIALAEARAASAGGAASSAGDPGAPATYMYRMSWRSPAADGAFGAYHGVPTPFIFDNPDLPTWTATLGDPPPRELSRLYNSSLMAFADTGDPNVEGLPHWPRYHAGARATLDWNTTPTVLEDPDAARRRLYAEAPATDWLIREPGEGWQPPFVRPPQAAAAPAAG
jgi:para-nitrobenzyl esterase